MNVAALIPVRSGSVRVKNKNLHRINGLSLLERKVVQLCGSNVDRIYVGSDSDEYLDIAKKIGAIPIKRSKVACDERVSPANEMIRDFVERLPNDIEQVVWAHCTNPFLYSRHYNEALDLYNASYGKFDSLISVEKVQSHMWGGDKTPVNYNPWEKIHTLAKSLEPVYFQNGGIFIQPFLEIRKNFYFFGRMPNFIVHNNIESFDINTLEEIEIAENIAPAIDKMENFNC